MVEVEVEVGDHELIFTAEGYYALKVLISVDYTGITCSSAEYGEYDPSSGEWTKVGDMTCDEACDIFNLSIHCYLKERVAPPPGVITSFEDWVESKGGCEAIKVSDILELREAYFGFIDIGFTVLVEYIATARECYLGLRTSLSLKLAKELEQTSRKNLISRILEDLTKRGV